MINIIPILFILGGLATAYCESPSWQRQILKDQRGELFYNHIIIENANEGETREIQELVSFIIPRLYGADGNTAPSLNKLSGVVDDAVLRRRVSQLKTKSNGYQFATIDTEITPRVLMISDKYYALVPGVLHIQSGSKTEDNPVQWECLLERNTHHWSFLLKDITSIGASEPDRTTSSDGKIKYQNPDNPTKDPIPSEEQDRGNFPPEC